MPVISRRRPRRLSYAHQNFIAKVMQNGTQDAVFPNRGPSQAVFGGIADLEIEFLADMLCGINCSV